MVQFSTQGNRILKERMFFFTAVLVLLFSPAISHADEKAGLRFITRFNPPAAAPEQEPPTEDFFYQTNALKLIGASLLRFYQVFISPQDVPSCPFTPTCAEYARQAVSRYGLIVGTVMAADRYQRCNGCGARFYPVDGETGRLIDPPERNHP